MKNNTALKQLIAHREEIWPSIKGVLSGRVEREVWNARWQYLLTKRYDPLITKCGYQFKGYPGEIIAWWDHMVKADLFGPWWPKSPHVVLDIGANLGIFGWATKKRYPGCTLIGFEPLQPECYHARSLGVYKHVSNYALGNETTNTVKKLDEAVVGSADVVKIDVDGPEVEVVEGGRETLMGCPVVIVECANETCRLIIESILKRKSQQLTKTDFLYVS